MKKLGLVVLAALLALRPEVARADSGIMEYIEGWSGPGPFRVTFSGVDLRVVCRPTELAKAEKDSAFRQYFLNCWQDDAQRVRGRLMFNYNTGANTGSRQLFSDDQNDVRRVDQKTIEVVYMYQLSALFEVGSGLQWVRLSGNGAAATATAPATDQFGFWRTGVPIRLTLTPLGNKHFTLEKQGWSRFVHLTFESTFFPGTTQASDFGNRTSKFKASNEFQGRAVASVDVAPLLTKYWPRKP